MAWECPTLATALNQPGGTEGIGPNPLWHQLQQPTVGHQHSLPDPGQRLMSMRATQRPEQQEATPVLFLNPDPITWLGALMRPQ